MINLFLKNKKIAIPYKTSMRRMRSLLSSSSLMLLLFVVLLGGGNQKKKPWGRGSPLFFFLFSSINSVLVVEGLQTLRLQRQRHQQHHRLHLFTSSTTSTCTSTKTKSRLYVSIGLGPDQNKKKEEEEEDRVLVAGIDYIVPNHEEYRTSRRSKADEQCDQWFEQLLLTGDEQKNEKGKQQEQEEKDNETSYTLGLIATKTRKRLLTSIPLVNDIELSRDDPNWTPYVTTRLPWTPLVPAYGLEQFGIPIPRRNTEAWRHFDVMGMIANDYSLSTSTTTTTTTSRSSSTNAITDGTISASVADQYKTTLHQKGAWIDDDKCFGRLVYINGEFVAQLSKINPHQVYNINQWDHSVDHDTTSSSRSSSSLSLEEYLIRLPDGFTETLASPTSNGKQILTSYQQLSAPNHMIGSPTSQFAMNTQQGTACFAALNTIKTHNVAIINGIPTTNHHDQLLPILIVNAMTKNGGIPWKEDDGNKGVAIHPRTLVIAQNQSRLDLIQTCVDLDDDDDVDISKDEKGSSSSSFRPKLYNGYTQIFIHGQANVTHSYLDESGGMVTPGVEVSDDENEVESDNDSTNQKEGTAQMIQPREKEYQRNGLRDTHLETMDVHLMGSDAAYTGTIMSMGGCGHIRMCLSVTILHPGCKAIVQGFSLSGGAQRTEMKTNIHHIGQGTTSRQLQKNMIGGRATGSFRGRIRVEQSAQQTDSEQLSRTVLLSDKARAWSIPSLEIIADDVKCSHGATVSDLSEEELFYLRSRGISRLSARNLLMYAFAADVTTHIHPAIQGTAVDDPNGLQQRILRRLSNVVPTGSRAIKGEYQSS